MYKQIHRARSRKSPRRHYHYMHNKCCASHQRACQELHKADRAHYIASLLGLAMYVLLAIVLAIACFITQNYTMLPLINVMVHELGYVVRHMVESIYVRMRNQHSVKREQKFLDAPKKRVEITDGSH